MTDTNIALAVHEELTRAEQAKKAADLLFEHGLISDAVSKLYYFLLYNVRALLVTESLEPKSHEGALRLLSLHFVKTGLFPPETLHIFSRLMKFREEADYNPSYIFMKEDYTEFRKAAENCAAQIRLFLHNKGFFQ